MTATLDPGTLETTAAVPAAAPARTTDPTARLMRASALVGPLILAASSVVWLGGGARSDEAAADVRARR